MPLVATRWAAVDVDAGPPPEARYRRLGRLRLGPLAEVWLARMFAGPGGYREILLHLVRDDLGGPGERADVAAAIAQAAEVAADLEDPAIAETVEVGVLDGRTFVAFEAERGVTLGELGARLRALGRTLPVPAALRIAAVALGGLAVGHRRRAPGDRPMVHGGLVPDAVLVTYRGGVRVEGFGWGPAALAAGVVPPSLWPFYARRSPVGGEAGSPTGPAALAPSEALSPAEDLRALALLLLELVSGWHFEGRDADLLPGIERGQVDLEAVVPPALVPALGRALASDPERRAASALELRAALRGSEPPASREALGRLLQSLFADRLRLEARARQALDDDLLVRALTLPASGTGARAVEPPGGSLVPVPAAREPALAGLEAAISTVELAADTVLAGPPALGRGPSPPPPAAAGEVALEAGTEGTMGDASPSEAHTEPGRRPPSALAAPSVSAPSASRAVPGRVGPYRVLRRLGRGAIAEVFLAEGPPESGGRRVAVKLILPELAEDRRLITGLMSEARLARALRHPNVVEMHECGIHQGAHYLVMEYVDGPDLATILARAKARRVEIPLGIALRIAGHVAAALQAGLEARGPDGEPLWIVHRDVAPQNILISRSGRVKLADFGLARAAGAEGSTRVGDIRGKPAYLAPERMVPDGPALPLGAPFPPGSAGHKADVFSLGAVLFEVLTLSPLFRRETPFATLLAVQRDAVPRISEIRPDVPPALDALVARMVSRFAEDRPSAAGLRLELDALGEQLKLSVTSLQIAAWLPPLAGED